MKIFKERPFLHSYPYRIYNFCCWNITTDPYRLLLSCVENLFLIKLIFIYIDFESCLTKLGC